MKEKTKHKKQQDATHPISESERVEEILEKMANSKEPPLKYDKNPRKLIPGDIEETSIVRLVKRDSPIW